MATAYILMVTKPACEHEVYTELLEASVDEVFPLYGEWDLITKISAETKEDLVEKIKKEIQPIECVINTKTLFGY